MKKKNLFFKKKFGDILYTRNDRKTVFLGVWEKISFGRNLPLIFKCWVEGEFEPHDYEQDGKEYGEAYCEFEDGTLETYGTDIVR